MNGTKKDRSVHLLLISGTDRQLFDFQAAASLFLNFFERRRDTINCSCFDDHFEYAQKVAEKSGITLQEIKHEKGEEYYKMIIQGQHPGWRKGDQYEI